MTHEQAIEILRNTAWLGSEDTLSLVEQAIVTVSVDRNIKKKAEKIRILGGETFICPVCKYLFIGVDNYCRFCGQAIDWEV